MIVDIPTSEDFKEAGLHLLHSAWEQVFDLFTEFDEFAHYIEEASEEDPDQEDEAARYWEAAKQNLTISYSTVHQAVEFLLKAKIAEVSPFLLLGGSPSTWPSGCDSHDRPFSDFRMINSEDLIKVVNTVHPEKLSPNFQTWFHELRTNRNKIMHTVDRRLSFSPDDIIPLILETSEMFVGARQFCDCHIDYLDKTPANSLKFIREGGHEPYLVLRLHDQITAAIERLSPSQVDKYFGFDKKRNSYWCPNCRETFECVDYFDPDSIESYVRTYQEKEKGQRNYRCFVCRHEGSLLDHPCDNEYCEGTRLDKETNRCLLCGYDTAL